MSGNFASKLGSLLSDVLETGEIPQYENHSVSGNAPAIEVNLQRDEHDLQNENYSTSIEQNATAKKSLPRFNFSQEKIHTAQIIRQGSYTQIPPEVTSAFSLLGCSVNASPAEVRRAFRKKIKQLHPDTAAQNSGHVSLDETALTGEAVLAEKLIEANETIKNWFMRKDIFRVTSKN